MAAKGSSKDRDITENTENTEHSADNTACLHGSAQAFDGLRETVARLRAADGCPWDRAQTHETLKPACVEEAAEVICGINILKETGKPDSLVEELGDLLLQVVMHAQIGEEEGLFSLTDVIDCVNEKMIRRHPHVFGEKSLEAIRKLREKRGNPSAARDPRSPDQSSSRDDKGGNPPAALQAAAPFALPEAQDRRLPGQSGPRDDGGKNQTAPQDGFFSAGSGTKNNEEEVKADWRYIKSLEKHGREWEEPYLFEAFDEAERLIDVARERKKRKS